MTLKKIAQEAGVSISTVSRVINQKSNAASPEVRDRIWEIVRRTGYKPNTLAQDLKRGLDSQEGGESHAIACLFARTSNALSDPFFMQLARSIEEAAFRMDYVVKYSFTALDVQNASTLDVIMNNHVKGVAILGRCDKPLLKFLRQHFNNVIYTGLNGPDAKYDQVICNGTAAARAAVNYLLDLGHRHIGYIGETRNEERFIGYRTALLDHNIKPNPLYAADVLLSPEGGYQGVRQLIARSNQLSAIFCANDITAMGALRALQEAGLRVPADVSVIGIDDLETSQYLSPRLTTVHIPIPEMGQMAAKILIDRINGGHKIPLTVSLPFQIITRESCAKFRD